MDFQSKSEKIAKRLSFAIENAESDIRYSTKKLIELSDRLSLNMSNISKGLSGQKDGYYFTINSIGEVQSMAYQIDCECAALNEKRNKLKSLLFITQEEK